MKLFFIFISTLFLLLSSMNGVVYGAKTTSPSDNHTAREEQKGKEIWEKLQAKQLECKNLTDDNYGSLGEYFMGQMAGSSHEAMNNMMTQMMGEQGEEQMHVVMGKRLSGCESNASIPQTIMGGGMMPMMMSMMSGNTNNTPMMGNWGQNSFAWFGFGSWLVTLTLVVWLIVGVLATIWLWKQLKKK